MLAGFNFFQGIVTLNILDYEEQMEYKCYGGVWSKWYGVMEYKLITFL